MESYARPSIGLPWKPKTLWWGFLTSYDHDLMLPGAEIDVTSSRYSIPPHPPLILLIVCSRYPFQHAVNLLLTLLWACASPACTLILFSHLVPLPPTYSCIFAVASIRDVCDATCLLHILYLSSTMTLGRHFYPTILNVSSGSGWDN